MKTTQGVLTHLNTVLKYELTNINQLFMHSRICQHWGLKYACAEKLQSLNTIYENG